jgi:hypothetical protein
VRSARLLACLAAASLTACGSDDAGDTSPKVDGATDARLAAAADRTAKETTSRMKFDVRATSAKESFRFTGEGNVNDDGSKMRMKGTLTEPGSDGFDMDMIMIRDVAYIRSASFEGVLPPGKRWMRVVDETSAPQTMGMSEFVELLRATEETEVVGAERVNGRQTTHFKSRVGFDELLEKSPKETADRMRKLFQGAADEAVLPIEVWIGEDDLIWRMVVDMDQGDIGGGAGEGGVKMTTDILEYGVEVDADPPPANTVADESELETG